MILKSLPIASIDFLFMISQFLEYIGRFVLNYLASLGRFCIFIYIILKSLIYKWYPKNIANEVMLIGYNSLVVIALTMVFSGGVLALQSYSGFSRFNAESSIPIVVAISVTRELAPVFTAIMIAARCGSAIAAKIGTMVVTDQIHAMRMLGANPISFVLLPKVIVMITVFPLLTLLADLFGIIGGYLVSINYLEFSSNNYIKNTFSFLQFSDVSGGLIKSLFFGFIISIISCYYGYNTKNGAEGVGSTTTNAVAVSCIIILLSNYIITSFLI